MRIYSREHRPISLGQRPLNAINQNRVRCVTTGAGVVVTLGMEGRIGAIGFGGGVGVAATGAGGASTCTGSGGGV